MNSNESENRLDGAHSVEVENVRQDDGGYTLLTHSRQVVMQCTRREYC